MSPECRRELQLFLQRATELGIEGLILPVHYINVPALQDETIEDELIKLLCTIQWEDWRELRFSDVTSSEYRRNVARLAEKLVEANKHAEEVKIPAPAQVVTVLDVNEDGLPGLIDTLADTEETLTKLPTTLNTISQEITQIVQIVEEATDDIKRTDAQGSGFGARLIIAKRTASRLTEPTDHIWSLSNEYTSQLHKVDSGFRIIFDRVPIEIKENPETKPVFCSFSDGVHYLSDVSTEAIESINYMIASAEPLERISRDLRPVLRRLKQGLTILIESMGITQDWIRLLDAMDLNCKDPSTPNPP